MAKTAFMKVWDVELGLAIHIKAPNGRYVVIDLGSTADVSPIQELWFRRVGYMVITHPHHDHFSDIRNIDYARPNVLWRVKAFSREELLKDVRPQDKDDFVRYCDFCDGYNKSLSSDEQPSSGNPFDGMKARVFSTDKCDKSNKNNFSAIVVIELGKARIVVCGDNEKASFDELMKREDFKNAVKNAWVLVAPHHGRESGYHEEFATLVNPYITIISDTKSGETSVTEKYAAKTRGWVVHKDGAESEKRYCVTTRNDGNILVEFGESETNKNGLLCVTRGVK